MSCVCYEGTLRSDIIVRPNTTVAMSVNRLSGTIPVSVRSASAVSVLSGNLFGCEVDRAALPRADPSYGNYECGSNSLDDVLYAWMALAMCGAVLLLFVIGVKSKYYLRARFFGLYSSLWNQMSTWSETAHIVCCGGMVRSMRQGSLTFDAAVHGILGCFAAITSCLVIVTSLVLYGSLESTSSAYEYTYAWSVTAAFLTGPTAAISMLVTWGCFVFWLLAVVLRHEGDEETAITAENHHQGEDRGLQATSSQGSLTVYMRKLAALGLLNVSVVVIANGAYVFAFVKVDSSVYLLIGVGLALFKLVLSSTVVDTGLVKLKIRQVESMMSANELADMSHSGAFGFALDGKSLASRLEAPLPRPSELELNSSFKSWSETSEQVQPTDQILRSALAVQEEVTEVELIFRMTIVLTNFVIVPCLGVLAVSVDCFFDLWNSQAEVKSQYSYSACYSFYANGDCIATSVYTFPTSYLPPFE